MGVRDGASEGRMFVVVKCLKCAKLIWMQLSGSGEEWSPTMIGESTGLVVRDGHGNWMCRECGEKAGYPSKYPKRGPGKGSDLTCP
jgi:RNase P subunit RPR2